MKVRITKLPQARTGYQVQGALVNDVPAMGGKDYNAYIGKPRLELSKYITAVPREEANLEAEGGETVYGDINGDGMAEHKIIKGPRHAQGGVPLNLPDDTFIFSDFKGMRLKDPNITAMFGKQSGSFTPAQLAKQYDIDKYRKILQDPNSDQLDRKTAEIMLKNYTMKLGALALAQEAKKGFPQGIPAVAMPYMEAHGLTIEDFIPKEISDTVKSLEEQANVSEEEDVETLESENQPDYESAQEINQGMPVAMPDQNQMMPMAQEGIIQRSSPDMQEYINTMNKYYQRKGQDEEFLPSGQGPMTEEQMYNWNEMQESLNPFEVPYQDNLNPASRLQNMQQATEDCPCMKEYIVQGVPKSICVPCEEMPMAAYGMSMGGYDIPFAQEGMQTSPWSARSLKKNSFLRDVKNAEARGYNDQPWFNMGLSYDTQNPNAGLRRFYDSFDNEGNYTIPVSVPMMMAYGGIPHAAYGMSMGINSQNYQGRGKRIPGSGPMFNDRTELIKAQSGVQTSGEVKVDVSGMDQATKERAIFSAQNKKENAGKKIIIVDNGKKYNVSSKWSAPTDITGADMKVWGDTPAAKASAAQYVLLEKSLKDDKVLNKLYEETIAALKNKESYKNSQGGYGQTWEQRGLKLPTKEQVRDQFLAHQKRNLLFQGKQIDPRLFSNSGQSFEKVDEIVRRGALNPKTGRPIQSAKEAEEVLKDIKTNYGSNVREISKKLGVPLDLSTTDRALQQATFHGYARMIDNSSKYDEDTRFAIRGFIPKHLQSGVADEKGMQGLFSSGATQISPIDDFRTEDRSIYGNSTLGHLAGAGVSDFAYEEIKDAKEKEKATTQNKKCPCQLSNGTTTYTGVDPNTGECLPCQEDVTVDVETPAPFWLQDTIKTAGAFGDLMRINKYMPWAPGVELEEPTPVYLDPTRDLAANAEQAGIQTQAMAQFAGPQALSARSSSIQGQSAKNAADILSRYNNANVNLANQFGFKATDIRNQEAMLRQATAQRLYDQNTIANQQYDNAKMAMRNQLRNYYTNAITNRWKTDALNQMFPQYSVDADVGGRMHFNEGMVPKAESSGATYDQLIQKYMQPPFNMDAESARKAANDSLGRTSGTSSEYQDRVNAINRSYPGTPQQKKGGAAGGFVYSELFTPFIM